MQDDTHSDASPPPSGGLIQIQARATTLGACLGPTWAALCGVMASNGFVWEQSQYLRLALVLLLVDAGWGTLWAALAGTNWALPLESWQRWDRNRTTARLPYTLPGSIGDRISRWLGKVFTWWESVLWPTSGPAVQAMLVGLPVTALVGALLGPELLLVSVAVLSAMQLAVIWERGHSTVSPGWDGFIAIAFPWFAGHLAFGKITLPSVGFALLAALAWGAAWKARSSGGRILLVASHALVAGGLIVHRRPLAGAFLLLILVPQMALLPWLDRGPAGERAFTIDRFVRYTRPWLMGAMVVAALVL